MKANIFRTIWIMFSAFLVFVMICTKFIVAIFRKKLTREKANQIIQHACKQFLKPVNLRFKIFNPYNVDINDGRRYIIMINHSSLYDIPVSVLALPGTVRMVGKKELFNIPLLGYAMTKAEHVKIDRKNRQQAMKDLQYAKQLMESGVTIWMAPEGTRSKDGKLAPLKKGGFFLALDTNAYIVPMGLRGTSDVLPPKTWQFYLNKTAEVHIGEPIYAGDYSTENKDELVKKVREQLRDLADVEFREASAA